jgi:Ca2+-binding EF-hand superfamily protein
MDSAKLNQIEYNQSLDAIYQTISNIISPNHLKGYLSELFNDLVYKSGIENKEALGKSYFQDFLNLPLFISDKIFNVIDTDAKGYLTKLDFVEGLFNLFAGEINQRIKLAFQIFDFNHDGKIEYDDICLILSHFHFLNNTNDTLSLLQKILNRSLDEFKEVDYDSYLNYISTSSSDFVLLFLYYLHLFKPYHDDSVKFYSDFALKSNDSFWMGNMSPIRGSPNRNKKYLFSENTNSNIVSLLEKVQDKLIIPPNDKSKATNYSSNCVSGYMLSPSKELLKYLNENCNFNYVLKEEENEEDLTQLDQFENEITSALQFIKNLSATSDRKSVV